MDDNGNVMKDFAERRRSQSIAIVATLFLIFSLALVHKRPDLFGGLSKNMVIAGQAIVITAFVVFSFFNWRCPSCHKYLGVDINRRICGHCKVRLR